MSDERHSGSVAFLAERHYDCVRPAGSLKRKLGQRAPAAGQGLATYPSPPMSNPPSPSRQYPTQLSGPPYTPQAIASSGPTSTALIGQDARPYLPSERQNPGSALLQPPTSEPPNVAPILGNVSSGPTSAFSSTENVFSVGSAATTGTDSSSAAQLRTGRKAKAHVASACMNCKRAHLSCDTQRPCTRCVAAGKQDTCFDVPHKKRGRPRLREESEFRVEQMMPEHAGQAPVPLTPTTAGPSTTRPMARSRHQRTESLRSLRSQTSEGSSGSSLLTPGYPPALQPGWMYHGPRPPSSGISAAAVPTAFLDLDFTFIRANRPFRQILSGDEDVKGRRLEDLVVPADGETFVGLRGRLKGEREAREPAFMPPILQAGEDPIQGVMEDDVERLATGLSDQTYTWTRARSGTPSETFPARVRLAKATAYFVVVTLPSFRPVDMLPPQPTPLPLPGFAFPPPRTPILPNQPPGPRVETSSAPPGPYYPHPGMTSSAPHHYFPSEHALQGRSYSSMQPQPFPIPSQRPPQPTTPRLPTAEPPMRITPITPLTTAARHQAPLGPSMQLPPLTATPSTQAAPPSAGPSGAGEGQPAESDDDDDSPRKRRRMDISDVLQR